MVSLSNHEGPRRYLTAAALALAAMLGACSPSDAIDAVGLLRDVGGTVRADDIRRTSITWSEGETTYAGDLYVAPATPPATGIVLVPGLAPEGRDDARLVALATALARRNFAVLVPELPGFRAQRVSAGDSVPIAAAIRHLRDRHQVVGVAAISYAVGPAILATLAPDPATRADFVVAIGGYFDAQAVTTFFTTGYFRDGREAPWQHAQPNEFGKWVFVAANAERLEDGADRTSLSAIARRKLADLKADIADLTPGLGAEGQAVMALLANSDPDRVPALLQALPPAIRADLEGLDLRHRDLSQSRARFIILHGRDDAIIPYTESLALSAALPAGQVELELLDSFAHAALGPDGLLDAVRLWRSAYALMCQRGAARPDAP
jgi:pimeloyl-ACP methyl ester carboxylesterase